jgi:hypothetical protein
MGVYLDCNEETVNVMQAHLLNTVSLPYRYPLCLSIEGEKRLR